MLWNIHETSSFQLYFILYAVAAISGLTFTVLIWNYYLKKKALQLTKKVLGVKFKTILIYNSMRVVVLITYHSHNDE